MKSRRSRLASVRLDGAGSSCTCARCGKPIRGGAHDDPCIGTSRGCMHPRCAAAFRAGVPLPEPESELFCCSFCGQRFALAIGKAGRCPGCNSIGFNGEDE